MWAANEDDARGEDIGPRLEPLVSLCSNRPRTADRKPRLDDRFQESLPSGACSAGLAIVFRLLECVINRDGKCGMRLNLQLMHSAHHPVQEEFFSLISAAVPV